jgi:ubiquinone/menaquinone biosynthesis C-methylase UbiE
MSAHGPHGHEPHEHGKRFHGGADRLRAPGRVQLLETPVVVRLCLEGLAVQSVLDVGTGTGIFAEAFLAHAARAGSESPEAAHGLRVVGIDPDPGLLLQARKLVPGVEFSAGIAERLDFADNAFDLVFLGHVLHETDDPLAALREARRVAAMRVAILEWPYVSEEIGPPLDHRLPPERIESLAREAGLKAIERTQLTHMLLYRFARP